jgi:hypothetical protein
MGRTNIVLDDRLVREGLRMPRDASELSGVTPSALDERMYCLLQDDSLITRVSVTTHQLLEPLPSGVNAAGVDLVMARRGAVHVPDVGKPWVLTCVSPNLSVDWTCPGKRGHAGYVKC